MLLPSLTLLDDEKERRRCDWVKRARHDQLAPLGEWYVWLILAGRGWGKTRTGAEWVRLQVRQRYRFVNIIGATADDARDIMIEGESGILAICPRGERPEYKKSQRRLAWPNGSSSLIFTADEPERLRGKQHEKLWADELAAWRYPEAWDQAMLGLRLGDNPQAVVTTTPRPTPMIKELIVTDAVAITKGTTYDNRDNLAPKFFAKIIKKYEGTRLGRQELSAEILDDNPNALFQRADIDRTRIQHAPQLVRVVVGVDPAATSNEDSDETGIIVAGRDDQDPPHYYVLADATQTMAKPSVWGKAAVTVYHQQEADYVVGEVNNGGDMVESVIETADKSVKFKAVRASRGKAIRAEPVASLYEQGRVHHVGTFPKLEDQMCDWDPVNSLKSPDRMDAAVWAVTELAGEDFGGIVQATKGMVINQAREEDRARQSPST